MYVLISETLLTDTFHAGRADYLIIRDNGDIEGWRNAGVQTTVESWESLGVVSTGKSFPDLQGIRFVDVSLILLYVLVEC